MGKTIPARMVMRYTSVPEISLSTLHHEHGRSSEDSDRRHRRSRGQKDQCEADPTRAPDVEAHQDRCDNEVERCSS